MTNHNKALVIIDTQRGFMPAEEGVRLGAPGFGELGVPDAQRIIPVLNKLTRIFADHGMAVVTTQDAHPTETAHFATKPNFVDTWPKHCVAGTPGAELHPELMARDARFAHFIKGDVAAKTPAEDDSYTGALAHHYDENEETEMQLPEHLVRVGAKQHIYLGGVALGDGAEHKLCVDSTAFDLLDQGFGVNVITDAVEAVLPQNRDICLRNMAAAGIRLLTATQAIAEVCGTPEIIR